jgi:hypothetical protein
MTDTRRVGHAQRRRMGAPSNVYSDTIQPLSFGPGDTVKAKGRYRTQQVSGVYPSYSRPDGTNDGHAYAVTGGKKGRTTVHLSGELSSFTEGMEEIN